MSIIKKYTVVDVEEDAAEVEASCGHVYVDVEAQSLKLTVEQAEDLIEALELAIQDACLEDDPYDDEDFDLDSELDAIFDETAPAPAAAPPGLIFNIYDPPGAAPQKPERFHDYVATFFD